ncbi:hypothetical protein C8J57DRAFT_1592962 [Mycena rebaudengoi]|nr:hypothetical protein C8J57DRAFT_1592962 [Mycena rebaudengoi]
MASYTTPPPSKPSRLCPPTRKCACCLLPSLQRCTLHTRSPHPPDGVLFPFPHGLEGHNHAQNTFFASPARRRPPPFHGLVWVVADDDLAPPPPAPDLLSSASSSEEDEDELDPMMDNDADKDAANMRPVHYRVQIQTAGLPLGMPETGTGTSSACTDASFFASNPLTDVGVEMVGPDVLALRLLSSSTTQCLSSSSSLFPLVQLPIPLSVVLPLHLQSCILLPLSLVFIGVISIGTAGLYPFLSLYPFFVLRVPTRGRASTRV